MSKSIVPEQPHAGNTSPAPYRLVIVASDAGGLSPEDAAELRALRMKHGDDPDNPVIATIPMPSRAAAEEAARKIVAAR